MNVRVVRTLAAVGAAAALATAAFCVEGYKDTPLLPGGKWHVHDPDRPQPKIVDPGVTGTPDKPGKAPSDAVVLFDGTDVSQWVKDNGQPATWAVADGYMEGGKGRGSIRSKQEFGDCQLHVEFATPLPVVGSGQGRGNSGVFMMGRYEVQVLDNYDNPTYADGTIGAIYDQKPPEVNACRKPGEWQTYDIIWRAPRFKDDKLEEPAYITVLLNGVLIQNHYALLGETPYRALPQYHPHGPTGPIGLQDHGNPVRYRNIWVRPLRDKDQLD